MTRELRAVSTPLVLLQAFVINFYFYFTRPHHKHSAQRDFDAFFLSRYPEKNYQRRPFFYSLDSFENKTSSIDKNMPFELNYFDKSDISSAYENRLVLLPELYDKSSSFVLERLLSISRNLCEWFFSVQSSIPVKESFMIQFSQAIDFNFS